MPDPTVLLAYLHPNTVSHNFFDSVERLVAWDLTHKGYVIRSGGPVKFRCGPGGLVEARNDVAAYLLSTDHDWLLFVDADMGFAADSLDRLLEVADPTDRPIVGGLCFALREYAPDGMGGWCTQPSPTVYQWGTRADGASGFAPMLTYPVNAVVPVAGTGTAFLLVHRSVFEKIDGDWFTRLRNPDTGQLIAEDLSFCARAHQHGFPVVVHTGVRTTHHKEQWVSEDTYWRSFTCPPATDEVAVIVPVLDRPQNAAPFMRTLRASTGLATAYAIASEDDTATADAWATAGAQVIVGPERTFAEKINVGYRATGHPWLFITGDDVAFRPGWLDHAQHVAAAFGADVIGTNDLGNPRVTAGEHATHLLIRRSYVDEHGASWDGPGVVGHEGYRHWFVDDEIVTCAKQRGVWAMALGSIVEHLHPVWGKAADDNTYRLGQSHADQDGRLYRGRLKAYT